MGGVVRILGSEKSLVPNLRLIPRLSAQDSLCLWVASSCVSEMRRAGRLG